MYGRSCCLDTYWWVGGAMMERVEGILGMRMQGWREGSIVRVTMMVVSVTDWRQVHHHQWRGVEQGRRRNLHDMREDAYMSTQCAYIDTHAHAHAHTVVGIIYIMHST